MKLEDKAEEKRKELLESVQDSIKIPSLSDQNCTEIFEQIINNFTNITPPEFELQYYHFSMREGGIGGGTSNKPGNILLNWKKLLVNASESILAIGGATAIPWLIPFAALVVFKKIYLISTIEISERAAALIWTMWKNCDEEDCIEYKLIKHLVNLELSHHKRHEMEQKELDILLKDLEKMKCIKEIDGNKWWLRETIKVSY